MTVTIHDVQRFVTGFGDALGIFPPEIKVTTTANPAAISLCCLSQRPLRCMYAQLADKPPDTARPATPLIGPVKT